MNLAFAGLALLTIAAAIGIVFVPKVMHAALLLGLCFIGVAGMFAVMGQELLAMMQVLINAGAVTVVFVFATMLSEQADLKGKDAVPETMDQRARRTAAGWSKFIAFLLGMAFVAMMTRNLLAPHGLPAVAGGVAAPVHSAADLGRLLFHDYLVPSELTSLILLAALVGAAILVRGDDSQ